MNRRQKRKYIIIASAIMVFIGLTIYGKWQSYYEDEYEINGDYVGTVIRSNEIEDLNEDEHLSIDGTKVTYTVNGKTKHLTFNKEKHTFKMDGKLYSYVYNGGTLQMGPNGAEDMKGTLIFYKVGSVWYNQYKE